LANALENSYPSPKKAYLNVPHNTLEGFTSFFPQEDPDLSAQMSRRKEKNKVNSCKIDDVQMLTPCSAEQND
jgi:hypothetical protein